MTRGFSYSIDGEKISTVDLTKFTTLDDEGVLTISDPVTALEAENSNLLNIGESEVNIAHLGVRVNAQKIPEHWDTLKTDRDFNLDRAVRNLRMYEAESHAINNFLPARPQWSSLAEIVGHLCELESVHGRDAINLGRQESEIRGKINQHVKSSNMNFGTKRRYTTGMPELLDEIEGIRSETRLAAEISRLGYGFEFEKTPGDLRVETSPEMCIDVTHIKKIPIQFKESEDGCTVPQVQVDKQTASVDAAVTGLRRSSWRRIQSKLGEKVDIVAVDVSKTLESLQLFALQEFGRVDIYHLKKQLEYLSESVKNDEQGVLFFGTMASASSPKMFALSSYSGL